MKTYPMRQRATKWGEPFVGFTLSQIHHAWLFYRRAPKFNKTARAYALHALCILKENAVVIEYRETRNSKPMMAA